MFRLPIVSALAVVAATAAPALAQTTTATPAPQTAPQTTPAAPGTTAAPADTAAAKPNPAVGGAQMAAAKPIVENLAAAPNLATLVNALKTAGVDTALAGPGPFTVFAPDNDAFGRLAPGTMDTLLKPENKATLAKILNYHVVSGKLDAVTLKKQIESAGGTLTLTTVAGQPLTAGLENGAITLTDANGTKAYVTTYDVNQSNGVFHVVNGVLVPKLG
ncbi:fasciclin domain-containing protein [Sphingomonas desiccabilis]|uniref:Fasciclin domain-containing protein n=1 Tax=Sphingomonas desiccabilis TaxID=429134 RepID=A0A4Q2IUJ3_9SPHN|nr:fasciclin domain-containing protein [Sphingomonas desiccabilis]MBB3911109.1 putative surface protein with fasciclin (FAS1) repeats [Sphingomonas desiccabilis]RXZ32081.1 fasciclin domain-containing protein [Sphingomonas desiccabilis]